MYNNDLSANDQLFKASYQNNKYGFMINNTFYEIGGGGMPALDFANPLHTFRGTENFIVTKDCYLIGNLDSNNSTSLATITINGTEIARGFTQSNVFVGTIYIAPLKISAGDTIVVANQRTTGGTLYLLDTL